MTNQPIDFADLLANYWRIAYAEGMNGRDHDTENGEAQAALSSINSYVNEMKKDADRYRHLRKDGHLKDEMWPPHGSVWVVQYQNPAGTIPQIKSAGFGDELDRNVDAEMGRNHG